MKRAQILGYRNNLASLALIGATAALTVSACSSNSDSDGSPAAGSPGAAGNTAAQSGATGSAGAAGGGLTAGSGGASAGAPGAGASSIAGTGGAAAGAAAGGAAGASTSGGSGGAVDPGKLDKFSFFVTSMKAMLKLAPPNGFGGDLRFGQTDGLSGADKICSTIAETSMPGASAKNWHAFLSTSKVNAADRIGAGPWYDRTGRLVANNLSELLQNRPSTANAAIKQDLPNEDGVPNHRPDPTKPADDNHHTLTGSNAQGKLYGATATCLDWTNNEKNNAKTGRPRIGFSWSIQDRTNWISGQDEGGCGAGVAVGENGGSNPNNPIVGSGGGYGGIYCFALIP